MAVLLRIVRIVRDIGVFLHGQIVDKIHSDTLVFHINSEDGFQRTDNVSRVNGTGINCISEIVAENRKRRNVIQVILRISDEKDGRNN